MKKTLANQNGFTVFEVEIVIVLALIIICVFVGAISYRSSKAKADAVACSVTRGRVATAVSQVELNKTGEVSPEPIGELEVIFLDNKFFDGCFENSEYIKCPNGGIISYSIKTQAVYCPVHFPMPE